MYACVCACVCVCVRACMCVRAQGCVSARARGHDDFGKHGYLYRPMAARLLADRATVIRDDKEKGREMGRRERMTGWDDESGGEPTGFTTSNNECLLPPAKPSFSLLQPADKASRASPSNPPFTIARQFARFPRLKREEMPRRGVSHYK